jgi:uncharacterized protein YgiB involved in biofilm formation
MMKKILLGAILVTSTMFLFSGCGKDDVKSVEYYKANIEEAKSVNEKCTLSNKNGEFNKENPSSPSAKLQNCQNANSAVIRIKHRPIVGDEPVQKTW